MIGRDCSIHDADASNPATSVDVERVFSKGRLLLSHVRSRMNANTTRAVLCVGAWSRAGYVKAVDLRKAAQSADLDDGSKLKLAPGWDKVDLTLKDL